MLEEQEGGKRGGGFDIIEIMAETHAQTLRRLHAGFDSEPLYTRLYNPRWPHSPEEYTLEMDVDVKRLRLEILFSKPLLLPPQDVLSPRQSHAAGTGLDEPGVSHAVT